MNILDQNEQLPFAMDFLLPTERITETAKKSPFTA
jgi:hypothetical protein